MNYKNFNVNPKGRKTGDCSTRALVSVLGIDYDECLKFQVKWALKTYYDVTSKQVMEKVLSEFGYVKMPQPRKANGTKYTAGEIDKVVSSDVLSKGVLITVAHHHTAAVKNDIIDIWDCRRKTIGNYYVKVGL